MSFMNRKRGVLGLAVLCTAALATTAAVASPQDTDVPTLSVKYHAADVAQPGGAERLYARIQRAARLVCQRPDDRDLAAYAGYRQCFDRAVDTAVSNVNVTALTALHRAKTRAVGA